MPQTLLFLFIVSLEPLLMHLQLFPHIDFGSAYAFVVYFQALLFFGFLLTLRRRWGITFFVAEALVFWLLLLYHRHFEDPLTLTIATTQLYEGLTFAGKSPRSLWNWQIGLVLVALLFKIVFMKRWYRPLYPAGLFRLVFFVPFLALGVVTFRNFHRQPFYNMDFRIYAASLGYPQAWIYEVFTTLDRSLLIDKTVEASAETLETLPPELQGLSLPNNVYLIQVESFDYQAFSARVNQKPLMPFLNQIADSAVVYHLTDAPHYASSNVDFTILTGATNSRDFYMVMYYLHPWKVYREVETLPKIMRQKGYYNSFYHGFTRRFYERGVNYERMAFDRLYFSEDLPITAKEGKWGYRDADLLSFVSEDNRKNPAPKKFNFIITVSSHEPFEVGEIHRKPFSRPGNRRELYYNSMNYVDQALQRLITQAPNDSLFIVYSDHAADVLEKEDTLLLIYDKRATRPHRSTYSFYKMPLLIKTLLKQ